MKTNPQLNTQTDSEASTGPHVLGVGTALPAFRCTQKEVWEFVQNYFSIKDSTKTLYRRVLSNPSIETRHFALDDLSEVLEKNHEDIHLRFKNQSVKLAAQALTVALQNAGRLASDIDYLAAATCTGYLCPGLSSYLVEALGLHERVRTGDLVGMGCGAAIPALEHASNFVQANPHALAAVVCVEICSADMLSDDDPEMVISNSIFGDGAAAVVLGNASIPMKMSGGNHRRLPRLRAFDSWIIPEWRDALRFSHQGGYLRNVLRKDVPERAGEAIEKLVARFLARQNLTKNDVSHWVMHPGGGKILTAVESALKLPRDRFSCSWNVLKRCGNMSSPSVLFALEETFRDKNPLPGETILLCSFGAGFSAYAALLDC